MLLPLLMQLGMLGSSSAGGDAIEPQGNYVYLSWSYEDELNNQRELSKIPVLVREAAVEAVNNNYYSPKKIVDTSGIKRLESMAKDLEIKITEQDLKLLKMEIAAIRALQILDDEETIGILM